MQRGRQLGMVVRDRLVGRGPGRTRKSPRAAATPGGTPHSTGRGPPPGSPASFHPRVQDARPAPPGRPPCPATQRHSSGTSPMACCRRRRTRPPSCPAHSAPSTTQLRAHAAGRERHHGRGGRCGGRNRTRTMPSSTAVNSASLALASCSTSSTACAWAGAQGDRDGGVGRRRARPGPGRCRWQRAAKSTSRQEKRAHARRYRPSPGRPACQPGRSAAGCTNRPAQHHLGAHEESCLIAARRPDDAGHAGRAVRRAARPGPGRQRIPYRSNRLMRWRVLLQAGTLLLFVLSCCICSNHEAATLV